MAPKVIMFELALVLAIGSFLQGAVGFAAGLLGMPLLVWLGWSLPESQAIILASTAIQNVWGVAEFRSTLEFKRLWLPALLRILCIPLGTMLLWGAHDWDQAHIRQLVGGFVFVMTLAVAIARPTPRESISPLWTWLVFPVSGIIQGFVGMGGPIMVLWVQAHDWSTKQSRAFLFAIYLVSLPFSMALLISTFGQAIVRAVLITLLMLPIILISTALGLRLGSKLGRRRMRQVTLVILLLISVLTVVWP